MSDYELVGSPTDVTKDDYERIRLIETQDAAISTAITAAPEPGPAAALIFHAHDKFVVLAGLMSLQEAASAKKTHVETGESFVFTLGGPVSGIAGFLRKGRFPDQAAIVETTFPPAGTSWVICVALGGATVAAIPVTPLKTLGSA